MNLDAISPEERLLYRAYNDLLVFGRGFLPGDFLKNPDADYQQVIADEINSDSQKPCAIILPRDHAKTTIIKCSIVHDFCYHREAMGSFSQYATTSELREFWEEEAENRKPRFYAWVSKSQSDSIDNVKYISKFLRLGSYILHYFGGDTGLQGTPWNQEDITTIYGDRLLSSSNLKNIRGKTEATIEEGAVRIYRCFADDFENEENTKTFLARKGLKDKLMASILPAIEVSQKRARLFLIGTPVHGDSLIQNILDDWEKIKGNVKKIEEYAWKILTWKATQPNMPGGVLWNGRMSRTVLNKKRGEFEARNNLALYYQEYELEVQSDEDRKWTRNHIKFWSGHYLYEDAKNYIVEEGNKIEVNTWIGSDPATDIDTDTADLNCVMAIAYDNQTNVYVLEYAVHRSIPILALRDQQNRVTDKEGVIDIYARFYDKYHAEGGTVEDVAMTRSFFQSFNAERSRVGSFLYDRWDMRVGSEKPAGKGAKLSRIYARLNDRFTSGKIHFRENMHELIFQTVNIGPRLAHDDVLETLDLACLRIYPPSIKKKTEDTEVDRYTGVWKPKLIKERRARQWQV